MQEAVDTIAALATAPGRGAVGIVRLSGRKAFAIARVLVGELPPPRQASLRSLREADGTTLDQALVLCFPAPHSFTGEDVVELQGHGGPVLLDLVLRAACAQGARVARPGEFSERAFLNGRLDLAQAEAIADLISASSAQAVRAAQRSLEGEFSRRVHALTEQLIRLRVHIEGALDFSDQDVDWLADRALHEGLSALEDGLQRLHREAGQGRRLQEGLTVVLSGAPNTGKSTLLNRLAGADVAIVTPVAGTTRDVLRESIVLQGLPLTVVDTAGLRETADPVEQEGIRRARAAAARADLQLLLLDDRDEAPQEWPTAAWVLHNKCDLSGREPADWQQERHRHLRLSAQTGAGMDGLIKALIDQAGGAAALEQGFSARTRHVTALSEALQAIRAARARLEGHVQVELAAEDLRLAQNALGEITGQVSSDELLGHVFSSFCIGK